jgi:pimeloyl-ACP methyl ester carboxylesterase
MAGQDDSRRQMLRGSDMNRAEIAKGAEITKGYVPTPEGQLHYRETGQGRPLLLIHPGPASSAMFEPVMPLLAAAGFRVIAIDVPGYGQSFRVEDPSMEFYAESLLNGLDALQVEAFDILGNHGGATIAMVMAVQAQKRVGRLALWGVGHFGSGSSASPSGVPPPEGRFSADGSEIAGFWRNGFKFTHVISPQFHLRRLIDLLQSGEQRAGHGPGDAVDHEALVAQVTQPVLVMSGEHDECWESSQIVIDRLPDARFQPIHDASVYVAEEFPAQLAKAVIDFLKPV